MYRAAIILCSILSIGAPVVAALPRLVGPDGATIRAPRPVRVMLASGTTLLRVRAEGRLDVVGMDATPLSELRPGEWMTCQVDARGVIRLGAVQAPVNGVRLRDAANCAIWFSRHRQGEWLPPLRLGGELRIEAGATGGMDVINEIDIETYVACVTAREAAPTFHREALRAQAILCRTYVLYQMRHRNGQRFDVVAGEASQVYTGLVDGPFGQAAFEAAQSTYGLVCTCLRDGRLDIFPTYYSSCCGHATQPAASLNLYDDVEPLRSCVICRFCVDAPREVARWAPVELPENRVRAALAAFDPRFTDWDRIRSVIVSSRTQAGRPLSLSLESVSGRRAELLAEHLRLALGSRVMRSTDCDIVFSDGVLRLENGRGFGHGLGACQWGMQGQALTGRTAVEILRYYFPGSRLTRVY